MRIYTLLQNKFVKCEIKDISRLPVRSVPVVRVFTGG